MSVISVEQFIQLADRLAANYDLLLQAEKKFLAPPNLAKYQHGQDYRARLLLDLTNTGTHILLRANNTGVSGNYIYFSIVVPSTPNAVLASQSLGTNLVLSLATDANSNPTTSVEEAVNFLQNTSDFTDYVLTFYPVTGDGGQVQAFPMTALAGGVGSGSGNLPVFTIMTTRPGPEANDYTLTIIQPTANSQVFGLCHTGNDLVITLPTDSSGNPTETLGQLQLDLEWSTGDFVLITESPSTLVPAVSKTNFSGGGVGSYAQVVLTPPPASTTGAADSNVVSSLLTPAQALDTNFTAVNLEQGLSYLTNLQSAMVNHFISVGYSGGMAGFMADNDILVHENFSTLNNNRVGQTLSASNVFRPDQIVLGNVANGSGGVTFAPGAPLGVGDGSPQTSTNYGPQGLVAVLVPVGGTLAANWSFTLGLLDNNATQQTSDTITFTAGAVTGAVVPITALTGSVTKFYSVSGATLVLSPPPPPPPPGPPPPPPGPPPPPSPVDQVFITQIIERQITL